MCPPQPPDGITELEFEVTDPAEFAVGLSAAAAATVCLEKQLRLADGSFVEYYTASACQPGEVRDHATGHAAVDSIHVIGVRKDELTFQLRTADGGVHATLKAAGTLPRSNVADGGTGRVVNLVSPGVEATAVIDAILDCHSGATLVARRIRDVDDLMFTSGGLARAVRSRLTDRQWEVLETAYRLGYFERPRANTGEEVAAALGITSATFSQHLRAAQRHVLAMLIDDEGEPNSP